MLSVGKSWIITVRMCASGPRTGTPQVQTENSVAGICLLIFILSKIMIVFPEYMVHCFPSVMIKICMHLIVQYVAVLSP
jgi:hypothetical protein